MRWVGLVFVFSVGMVCGLQRSLWEKAFETGDFEEIAARTEGLEQALALLVAGRTKEAMCLLEGRRDSSSLRLYGYAACCEGRWARALDVAEQLLKQDGGDVEAIAIKAEALLALGDGAGARPLLERLPGWMSAYVRLRVALREGDEREAASAAEELCKMTGSTAWLQVAGRKK